MLPTSVVVTAEKFVSESFKSFVFQIAGSDSVNVAVEEIPCLSVRLPSSSRWLTTGDPAFFQAHRPAPSTMN
jgi:hypothetical protein